MQFVLPNLSSYWPIVMGSLCAETLSWEIAVIDRLYTITPLDDATIVFIAKNQPIERSRRTLQKGSLIETVYKKGSARIMVSVFRKLSQKRMVAGLLLAASVSVVAACAEVPSETTTPEEAAENVTTEEVSGGAEGLIGQTVSIRSEVAETVGEASFLLEDDQLFGGEDILVINASGEPFVLTEGDDTPVQVTGEVQQLVIADFETEYGLDLDPTLYAEYEDRPVVVAQSLALSPDPGDITANPEAYYNKRIAVMGEVEDKLDGNTFTLDEEELFGAEDLLVVSMMASPQANDGENVTVTGVLRPYVKADFETDYDLTWDLSVQEQVEAEYTEKPVFVADEVYPSAL